MNRFALFLVLAPIALSACGSPAPAVAPPVASPTAPAAPPLPSGTAGGEAQSGGQDPYASLVARAEGGDETVDFLALRMAYLESPAFARGIAARERVRELRKGMFAAMHAGDSAVVRDKARETLALVYVDLEAQKARYQACAAEHDEACAGRGKRIEQGLLRSVVSTGDGRSCAASWRVVTIDEEYFVLRMLGTELRSQALVKEGGHVCDKLDVTNETGQAVTYYFDVGSMLKAEGADHARGQ